VIFRPAYALPRASIDSACAIAVLVLMGLASSAHATCPITVAEDLGGPFGTDAVAASACFVQTMAGASGVTSASVPLGGGTMSASADLSSGVLTAYSAGGIASAAEWDTFTFTGLPAGGETITATLSLSGTLTGDATGLANLQAGPSATFGDVGTLYQDAFFGNGNPIPASIDLQVTVTDASSLTVLGDILADGFAGNVADLTDPPTLSLDLPAGVTATSASGVFTNFQPLTAVPEPWSAGLLLVGLGALIQARRRRQLPTGPTV
jgi:hypothetical protein